MSQTINLKIYQHNQLVETKTLSQDVIKIGKLKSSHLCLEDDAVARMHAVIEVSGSDVRVIDLGSSTGTLLNGQRVEKNAVLKHGDVLQFGPYRVDVEFGEAGVAVIAPQATHATQVPMQPAQPPMAAAAAAPVAASAMGMPMAAPVQAPMQAPMQVQAAAAPRPVIHVDAGEVEVQDGSTVTEVMTMYGRTVVDVQHVGQVKSKRATASAFIVLGSVLLVGGASLFAYDASQDWTEYQKQLAEANEKGRPAPQPPGTGFGSIGVFLVMIGLVPLGVGAIRLNDRGLNAYTIGEGHHATFHAPTQGLPDSVAFPLVRGGAAGEATLNFTPDMTGDVTLDGQKLALNELVSAGRAGAAGSYYSFPLPSGAHCRVSHNGITYHVNSVPPGRVIAQKSEADKPFWLYTGGSFVVLGVLLTLTFLKKPDEFDLSLDDLEGENRFVGYMNQPDEIPEEPPPPEQENSDDEAGGTGQRHKGEEGKMGNPSAKAKSGLYAMKGPKDAVPQMARNFDPDMMSRNAGILGLMQQESGHFLASPYGGAFAVGNDDEDVWGGLTGTEIGEAYGVGGLGLVGTGRGGGGTGEGTIGLGNTGLIGKGGGGGTGSGYGRGAGAGFGGRGTRVPTVRQAKAEVQGALDKDIIRRIVRAHINEVRYCYNQALARDPNAKGRVAVQFTIGGTGKVPTAVVQESTMKDPAVGSCIAQAVRRWTFPKPEGGGSVIVSYPFVLEPG